MSINSSPLFFVSMADAVRYYIAFEKGDMKATLDTVLHKEEAGEIRIGMPPLRPGEALTIVDEGTRYLVISLLQISPLTQLSIGQTVFVVTKGIYPDKRIIGVFDNRSAADTLASLCSDGSVYEFELNAVTAKRGDQHYLVTIWSNSDEYYVNQAEYCIGWPDEVHDQGMTFYMWANSEEHAVKIASDRRAARIQPFGQRSTL